MDTPNLSEVAKDITAPVLHILLDALGGDQYQTTLDEWQGAIETRLECLLKPYKEQLNELLPPVPLDQWGGAADRID